MALAARTVSPRDVERLVHGLVPRLLLGGDVHGRLGGVALVAGAGVRVHDLAGAGRIVAGRRIGRTLVAFVVAVPALAVAVVVVSVLAAGLGVAVVVLTVAVVGGGIGLVVGVPVIAVGRRLAGGRSAGGGIGGCVAVVAGIAVLGLEAVACSTVSPSHASASGGSVKPASRMSAWVTSCEAICQRSGSRSPRRVWCFNAQAITTRAIAVSMRCESVSATQRGE